MYLGGSFDGAEHLKVQEEAIGEQKKSHDQATNNDEEENYSEDED